MKQSRTIVEKRRQKILDMINKTGDIKVVDVAEFLHVSAVTIRRDLQYLNDERLIETYYGGARTIDQNKEQEPEEDELTIARKNIAKYAASLVQDDDCIFINTSATALEMLSYIKARNVTVITNNGNAIGIKHSSKINVILTGGELRYIKGAMVGEFALNNVLQVTAKKSFIGCSGISIESGMTTELLNEVKINEAMVSRVTGDTYILADCLKIGKNSSFVSCPIDDIKHIITDEKAPELILDEFRERGIQVHQVKIHETE